jgi:hypothetical protein
MQNSSDESRPRPRPQPHQPPSAEPAAAPPAQPPPLTPPLQPPPAPRRSRRWFLGGSAAVVLGAGAGVAGEFARNDHAPALPPTAPAVLVAAAAAERALLADLDATTGGSPEVRRVITQVRADHAAHLAALSDLLARYRKQPAHSSAPAAGAPRTLAQLNAAERAASTAAAAHAAAADAGLAAMLASIAACEATHAELLR